MKKGLLLLLAAFMVFSAGTSLCADNFKPYPLDLQGKKIAIFLDNYFQLDEAWYTPLRLKESGADVKIVSHYSPTVERDHFLIKTDITPETALKTKWDGVVVIGGFSPLEMREDKNVISIVKDTYDRKALVAAICHGVCVLVTADIIKGKNVTGNLPRSIEFSNAGAIFHDKAPQIDGNIVTAIGPADNGNFLDAIQKWLTGGEKAAKENIGEPYLKGKKIAVVIDNRYEYSQAKYPFVRFTQNGASVYYVAATAGTYAEYKGVGGTIKADISAQDAMSEHYDAIILVSNWAADSYRRSADVQQFVARNLEKGTLVASMNWGHTVMINAKCMTGYEVASTWGMQNDIRNAGGKPVLEPVHRDRNLITCANDEDMPELMRYVVGYLTTVGK